MWKEGSGASGRGGGQTGPIELDWLDVSFFDKQMKSLAFKGPGSFEITVHDAAPDNRRMKGVMSGTGLTGSQDAEGQTLDAVFDFDMNFSCGTK